MGSPAEFPGLPSQKLTSRNSNSTMIEDFSLNIEIYYLFYYHWFCLESR